jgi:hypothetical protein
MMGRARHNSTVISTLACAQREEFHALLSASKAHLPRFPTTRAAIPVCSTDSCDGRTNFVTQWNFPTFPWLVPIFAPVFRTQWRQPVESDPTCPNLGFRVCDAYAAATSILPWPQMIHVCLDTALMAERSVANHLLFLPTLCSGEPGDWGNDLARSGSKRAWMATNSASAPWELQIE